MSEPNTPSGELDQFILEHLDTVPHLEALLLLWRSRPKVWAVDEMARALYVPAEFAENILRDLALRGLIEETEKSAHEYQFVSVETGNRLMDSLDAAYRRELIRITRMIHSKAPSAVREFARAFRFTKEKERSKE